MAFVIPVVRKNYVLYPTQQQQQQRVRNRSDTKSISISLPTFSCATQNNLGLIKMAHSKSALEVKKRNTLKESIILANSKSTQSFFETTRKLSPVNSTNINMINNIDQNQNKNEKRQKILTNKSLKVSSTNAHKVECTKNKENTNLTCVKDKNLNKKVPCDSLSCFDIFALQKIQSLEGKNLTIYLCCLSFFYITLIAHKIKEQFI